MSNDRFRKGVGYVEDKQLERYHAYEATIPHRRRVKNAWQKAAAIAACLALLVSTILFRTPPERIEGLREFSYTEANNAAVVIGCGSGGAYFADGAYSNIASLREDAGKRFVDLPTEAYLSVYTGADPKKELNKEEFEDWMERIWPKVAASLGVASSQYTIVQPNSRKISAEFQEKELSLKAEQWGVEQKLYARSKGTAICLDGKPLQITVNVDDWDDLSRGISQIRDQVCRMFGLPNWDMNIGVPAGESLSVYIADKSAHPFNRYRNNNSRVTDYVSLIFQPAGNAPMQGTVTLNCVSVGYMDFRVEPEELFPEVGKARCLSVAEAAELLKKGYVFGGTVRCCECAKREADLSTFEYVCLNYRNGFPFYIFYVKAERDGVLMSYQYAVPAIEVFGMEEQFAANSQNHANH